MIEVPEYTMSASEKIEIAICDIDNLFGLNLRGEDIKILAIQIHAALESVIMPQDESVVERCIAAAERVCARNNMHALGVSIREEIRKL